MTTTNESSQSQLSTADFAAATEQRDDARNATPTDPQANDERVSSENRPIERRAEDGARETPLFTGNDGDPFHRRWSDIQASFVDEPRGAVEQADSLVA